MPAAVSLTHEGKTLTVREWCALKGRNPRALLSRINRLGWSVARALDTPERQTCRRGGRHPASAPRLCPRLKRTKAGKAYCRWKAHGSSHERYFGPWGEPATNAAYRRFAAEWSAGTVTEPALAGGISVGALVMRWMDHVEREYVKDGKATSERSLAIAAARGINNHAGARFAADVTPADLRAVRNVWLARKLSLNTINSYHARMVRMFGWAVGESLVPVAVWQALKQVERLRPGRTTARDPEPRKPATDEQIAAALPHLSPSPRRQAALAAMVTLQRLTGMRPGEVCALAPGDLDRAADVWRYTVGAANKNRHRGKAQVYYLGPRAVAALTPFLVGVADDRPVFGIAAANYGKAVAVACVKAGCPHWTPHQLRHALATEVAERFRSLDHAAAAIGDTNATAQAVYVHVDPRERAKIEVARAMG